MIILGIDPGISNPMGLVAWDTEQNRVTHTEVFRFDTIQKGTRPGEVPLSQRLYLATHAVRHCIVNHTPCAIGIEEQIGRYNIRSLIETSYLVGRIQEIVDVHDAVWYLVKPAQAKQALATTGTADKAQMIAMAVAYGVALQGRRADREALADALGVALATDSQIQGRMLVERATG
jgi:Holliday junction resolvasome RuvABC endonuclease subunit